MLVTAVTATFFLVAGGAVAFADSVGVCYAGGAGSAAGVGSAGGSAASGVVLASTGSGMDITTWTGIGVGLVLLGVYLMAFWPGRRRGQVDTTTA